MPKFPFKQETQMYKHLQLFSDKVLEEIASRYHPTKTQLKQWQKLADEAITKQQKLELLTQIMNEVKKIKQNVHAEAEKEVGTPLEPAIDIPGEREIVKRAIEFASAFEKHFEKAQQIRLETVKELEGYLNAAFKGTDTQFSIDNFIYDYKPAKGRFLLDQATKHSRPNKRIRELLERGPNQLNESELEELITWTNRRNELFARDTARQIYNSNAKAVMEENGLEDYIWRTMRDSRVRPKHAEKEGNTYNISDEPTPGSEWGCRCWMEMLKNTEVSK